jgi:hypothetical protein
MITAAQARQSLEHLGLAEAAAVLDGRLEAAAQKQLPYADFLAPGTTPPPTTRRGWVNSQSAKVGQKYVGVDKRG